MLNETELLAAQKLIIKAAKRGSVEATQALLAMEPTLINARDIDGSTPLHCAAWKGFPDVVTVLLDAGADINAVNNNDHWGDTPLHAAAHGGQKPVAEVLITRGANLNAVNPRGNTPLAETEVHKATSVANLLKKHGAT